MTVCETCGRDMFDYEGEPACEGCDKTEGECTCEDLEDVED